MPDHFFITGTDTGIGKTLVSALLCASLDAVYWKPIQTGTRGGTDRRTVMRLAKLSARRTIPEVYKFSPPVSPHLAARRAGVRIELRKIKMPPISKSRNLIAEGAGGVLVPVNASQKMTHLMAHLRLPVILVARSSLGTINHTLLSLDALRTARLNVRGVVMSGPSNRENRGAIEHYGHVQVIGIVPFLAHINRKVLLHVFRSHFDRGAFVS